MLTESYRFSHCMQSIARKVEKSEAERLAYIMDCTQWYGEASPLRDGWDDVTKCGVVYHVEAEVTAEHRSVYRANQHTFTRDSTKLTNRRRVQISACFFMNSLSYSSASLR